MRLKVMVMLTAMGATPPLTIAMVDNLLDSTRARVMAIMKGSDAEKHLKTVWGQMKNLEHFMDMSRAKSQKLGIDTSEAAPEQVEATGLRVVRLIDEIVVKMEQSTARLELMNIRNEWGQIMAPGAVSRRLNMAEDVLIRTSRLLGETAGHLESMNEGISVQFQNLHTTAFQALVSTDRVALVQLGKFVSAVLKTLESWMNKFRGSDRLVGQSLLLRWQLLCSEIDDYTPEPQQVAVEEVSFEEGFKKLFERTVDSLKVADVKWADRFDSLHKPVMLAILEGPEEGQVAKLNQLVEDMLKSLRGYEKRVRGTDRLVIRRAIADWTDAVKNLNPPVVKQEEMIEEVKASKRSKTKQKKRAEKNKELSTRVESVEHPVGFTVVENFADQLEEHVADEFVNDIELNGDLVATAESSVVEVEEFVQPQVVHVEEKPGIVEPEASVDPIHPLPRTPQKGFSVTVLTRVRPTPRVVLDPNAAEFEPVVDESIFSPSPPLSSYTLLQPMEQLLSRDIESSRAHVESELERLQHLCSQLSLDARARSNGDLYSSSEAFRLQLQTVCNVWKNLQETSVEMIQQSDSIPSLIIQNPLP